MRLASLTVIASYLLRCHQRGSMQSQHAPFTSSTANVHSIRPLQVFNPHSILVLMQPTWAKPSFKFKAQRVDV